MTAPEFSRLIDRRQLATSPQELSASPEERAALARRFGLVRIDSLDATIALEDNGQAVLASGQLLAAIVQSCAVSGEDLPVTIDESVALRFVLERPITDEELELEEGELDDIPFEGKVFDLGEAVAQSLALAIDPYAVGPEAERTRKDILSDQAASGPFAALAALKKD